MFQQGMFSIDPNATPREVAQRRAQIMRMMPRFGSAQYTGQGLAHLAAGILGGKKLRGLDQFVDERRPQNGLDSDKLWAEFFGVKK